MVTLHSGQTPRMEDRQVEWALWASATSLVMGGEGGTERSKAEKVPEAFCGDSRSYCQNIEPRVTGTHPISISSPHPASPVRHSRDPLLHGAPPRPAMPLTCKLFLPRADLAWVLLEGGTQERGLGASISSETTNAKSSREE